MVGVRLLQVPIALFGLYNLYRGGSYFFTTWLSLRGQGIPALYLVVGAFFGFWWLMLAIMMCFLASAALQGAIEDGGFGRWLGTLVSLGGSFVFPQAMIAVFFVVITFVWPWVAKLF